MNHVGEACWKGREIDFRRQQPVAVK